MDRSALRQRLREELGIRSSRSYDELVAEVNGELLVERGAGAVAYQVEVQVLERTAEYVQVGVSVMAGSWSAILPVATSFFVHRDGRVERPEWGDGEP